MKPGPKPTTLAPYERVMARVLRVESGCLEWQGALSHGYGTTNINQKMVATHKIVSAYHFGPTELDTLHKCDNRKCCDHLHLEYGTHMKNIRDARDRLGTVGSQKLTRQQAWTVKYHEPGKLKDVAARYSISMNQVSEIRLGKSWKDLTEDGFG